MKKIRKQENFYKEYGSARTASGITLIALVVTIIVLLILAGVTIALIAGSNGLFNKTENAVDLSNYAIAEEKIELTIVSSLDDDGVLDIKVFKQEILKQRGSIVSEDTDIIIVEIDGYQATIEIKTGKILSLNTSEGMQTPILFLQAKYIGTRAFTVEIDTAEQEITKFCYYLNDEKKEESNNNVFTVENLEPETTYKVRAILEDNKGNSIDISEIEITTEPYTYLYLNGNEYMELTGGFETEIISFNGAYGSQGVTIEGNGQYSSGSITKNADNHFYMTTTHPGISSWGNTSVAICSKKVIDFSKYRKIYVEGEFKTNYNAVWNVCFLDEAKKVKSAFSQLNKELDLKDIINEESYLKINMNSSYTGGTTGSLTIKSIKLEK